MARSPAMFHAFLRPSILQMLRAAGYHSTRPAVLDTLTDIAARYLTLLCERTASHAVLHQGNTEDFTLIDVRLALQDMAALMPEKIATEQETKDEEDTRGVEEFIQWFSGSRMKEMMEMGSGDTDSDATDYLAALKKKHSKTGDDAKWQGTIFGKYNDVGEILVEGGQITSINEWISHRAPDYSPPQPNGEMAENQESRPPSSGLSSVGDRLREGAGDDMDLT